MSRIARGRIIPLDFSRCIDPATTYSKDTVQATICLDCEVRDEEVGVESEVDYDVCALDKKGSVCCCHIGECDTINGSLGRVEEEAA